MDTLPNPLSQYKANTVWSKHLHSEFPFTCIEPGDSFGAGEGARDGTRDGALDGFVDGVLDGKGEP